MANKTIHDLTLAGSITDDDFIPVWVEAGAVTRRVSRATLLSGTLKKSGTPTAGRVTSWSDADTLQDAGFAATAVARKTGTPTAGRVTSWSDADTVQDGGFALTDVARLSQAQTFAADQRIDGLVGVNVAPSSAAQLDVVAGGSTVRGLRVKAAASPMVNTVEVVDTSGTLSVALTHQNRVLANDFCGLNYQVSSLDQVKNIQDWFAHTTGQMHGLFVMTDMAAHVALFLIRLDSAVVLVAQTSTTFSATKDTAGRWNVYIESGNCKIQNKVGANRGLLITRLGG